MAPWQRIITYAAIVTLAGQIIFLVNLFWSIFKGPRAEANPWESTTLEWTLPSPTPEDGFGVNVPTVVRDAYEFGGPHDTDDDGAGYQMQNSP
jgi:cytochrome c oxidase subunit 1